MKPFALVIPLALLAVVFAGCTAPTSPEPDEEPLGARMAEWYTAKPYRGGQETPAHVWFENPDDTLVFLHLDNDDVQIADGILFVGTAFPGKFCKGDAGATQAEIDSGYVHFHKKSSANWDAGHGGGPSYAASQDGYWLRHIGAFTGSIEMMGQTMQVQKGKVFPLMPSDQIPDCPLI